MQQLHRYNISTWCRLFSNLQMTFAFGRVQKYKIKHNGESRTRYSAQAIDHIHSYQWNRPQYCSGGLSTPLIMISLPLVLVLALTPLISAENMSTMLSAAKMALIPKCPPLYLSCEPDIEAGRPRTYGVHEYACRKKGAVSAISHDRINEGSPFDRSSNVKYLLACRCPPVMRKLNTNLRYAVSWSQWRTWAVGCCLPFERN